MVYVCVSCIKEGNVLERLSGSGHIRERFAMFRIKLQLPSSG